MSDLQVTVDKRFPVAVVLLSGCLDARSVPAAELALWECLADMPAAVVIDGSALEVKAPGWQWLGDLRARAARWPCADLVLAGISPANGQPIPCHDSVEAALSSLGQLPLAKRRQLTLPPDPDSCARARDLVVEACADWGLRRPKRLAELLISELVANGVMHARTDLMVTVRLCGPALELSVLDESSQHLAALAPDPRGFGLQLVEKLSDSWGWQPTGHGKVVWSRLPA